MKTTFQIASFFFTILIVTASPPAALAQGVMCPPDSRYVQERVNARLLYAERQNADLTEIILNRPPDLDRLYAGCVNRIVSLYEQARNLIFGRIGIFTATPAIIDILVNQARGLIDRECRSIIRETQESYRDIADVVPAGDFFIDLDRVVDQRVRRLGL